MYKDTVMMVVWFTLVLALGCSTVYALAVYPGANSVIHLKSKQ